MQMFPGETGLKFEAKFIGTFVAEQNCTFSYNPFHLLAVIICIHFKYVVNDLLRPSTHLIAAQCTPKTMMTPHITHFLDQSPNFAVFNPNSKSKKPPREQINAKKGEDCTNKFWNLKTLKQIAVLQQL